jgi:hypothetical protein
MVSTSCIRLPFYSLVIKAQLKLSLHDTQTYDGVQVQLHVFLNPVLNEDGQSSSHDGRYVRKNTACTGQEDALAQEPVGTQRTKHVFCLMGIEPCTLGHAVSTFAISASHHLYNRNCSAVAVDCG